MDGASTLLKALAHPLRLRVVDRLGHRGPAPVSQLAAELDATLPELSNGLRQLRDAGIVVASRDGPHRRLRARRRPAPGAARQARRPGRAAGARARPAPVAHVLRPPRRAARRRPLRRAGRPRRASARRRRHGRARRSRARCARSAWARSSLAAGGWRSSASTRPSTRRTSRARSGMPWPRRCSPAAGWSAAPGARSDVTADGRRRPANRARRRRVVTSQRDRARRRSWRRSTRCSRAARGALLIEGEAGIGKTALLAHARSQRRRAQCCTPSPTRPRRGCRSPPRAPCSRGRSVAAEGLGERALRGELADPSADQVVHALWWLIADLAADERRVTRPEPEQPGTRGR